MAADRPLSPTLPTPPSPRARHTHTPRPQTPVAVQPAPSPPPRPATPSLPKPTSNTPKPPTLISSPAQKPTASPLPPLYRRLSLRLCARVLRPPKRSPRRRPPGPGAPIGAASLSNSFTAKSSSCTADTLLTVAGLQHLVANHQHILSETVYRAFEVPLLHELDKWRGAVDDEEEGYARAVAEHSKEIRRMEKEGMKLHRQRRRDVARFRSHLVELTTKLDGLTVLHGEHARTLLRESQDTSVKIVEASCSLARAEVDIFESLAKKGWTGGGLEDVLERGVDLFAAELDSFDGTGKRDGVDGGSGLGSGEGNKLFSILPPKSILADTSGPDMLRAGGKDTRSDSLLVDTDRYQSLAGAVSRERDRDTDSVFSDFNRSRNVRPFSPQPQPLKLNPEDLLGSLEDGSGKSSSKTNQGGRHGSNSTIESDDGCAVEDEHEDDEEAHPWRNEGLRHEVSSDDEGPDKVGASLGDPQQREESWNASDVNT
ncbi:hypothetical protein N0V88_003551 [Collariella sp. IMI 366227]|nr:hypothetical protein N0V88_003551 [Collariella sp. IMI 366227]